MRLMFFGRGRSRRLLLSAGLLVALTGTLGHASNGIKSPAVGGRSYGRAGTGFSFADDATSMHINPALITRVHDENIVITPSWLMLDVTYSDARNSSQSSKIDGSFFLNSGYVFDFHQTREEILAEAEEEAEANPYRRSYPSAALPERAWVNAPVSRTSRFPVTRLPGRIEVSVKGAGEVSEILVIAKYPRPGSRELYSQILGSQSGRFASENSRYSTAALFEGLINRLSVQPSEIVVHYKVSPRFRSTSDSLEVRVKSDGKDMAGTRTTVEDLPLEEVGKRTSAASLPAEAVAVPEEEDGPTFKVGLGQVVMSGAGADFNLATSLYPGGVRHYSEMSFVALAPTVGLKLSDSLSVGASLQINAASMMVDAPHTEGVELLRGRLFPEGSLDSVLGGDFGLPAEMGPAMKYALDTAATHQAGTSITHTAKGNDSAFSRVTGVTKIKNAEATGLSGRFGLLLDLLPGWNLGVTYQTKTKMDDFVGRASIDFNRQIDAFVQNPTVGHSNEISIAGVPTEMRFTFDDVWNRGVVDVYMNNGTVILNDFTVPSGAVKNALPNQGRNGFAANYDVFVHDFNMPAELGLGTGVDLASDLTLLVDWRRIFWSQTMDELTIELRNGDNADINALVGSSRIETTTPLGWQDQDVYGLGLEYDAAPWLTLRGGYNYGKNPMPADTYLPLFPGITEHHLAIGFTLKGEEFTIDFGFMRAINHSIEVSNSEQTPDMNGSTTNVAQNFIVLGISHWY